MNYWGDTIRGTQRGTRRRRAAARESHPAETVLSLRAWLALSVALNILLIVMIWRFCR